MHGPEPTHNRPASNPSTATLKDGPIGDWQDNAGQSTAALRIDMPLRSTPFRSERSALFCHVGEAGWHRPLEAIPLRGLLAPLAETADSALGYISKH